jgi:hypothetical protein
MTYGLTPDQRKELDEKLEAKIKGATVKGAIQMREEETGGGSFSLTSASLTDESLAKSVVHSGRAPILEGGKVAAASSLTQTGAELLATTFEETSPITDISVNLALQYETQVTGAEGRIIVDWEKMASEREKLSVKYDEKKIHKKTRNKDCAAWDVVGGVAGFVLGAGIGAVPGAMIAGAMCDDAKGVTVQDGASKSYSEMHSQVSLMEELGYIKFEFAENYQDERNDAIREAFLQYFINIIATPEPPAVGEQPEQQITSPSQRPGLEGTARYRLNVNRLVKSIEKKKQVITIKNKIIIRWPFAMTANVGEWYSTVSDCNGCVQEVILGGDEFFQSKEVIFTIPSDVVEAINDGTINYVTVGVRKQRKSGKAFQSSTVVNKKYVGENGNTVRIEYSGANSDNPSTFDWNYQMAMRGGKISPETVEWNPGDMSSPALPIPLIKEPVYVAAFTEDLEESGVRRATLLLRYPQLGAVKQDRIVYSTSKGDDGVSKSIYLDADQPIHYAVVVNHRTEGQLGVPCDAERGDDCVDQFWRRDYTFNVDIVVPEDLFVEGDLKDIAKKAAKDLTKSATKKALEKLEALFE